MTRAMRYHVTTGVATPRTSSDTITACLRKASPVPSPGPPTASAASSLVEAARNLMELDATDGAVGPRRQAVELLRLPLRRVQRLTRGMSSRARRMASRTSSEQAQTPRQVSRGLSSALRGPDAWVAPLRGRRVLGAGSRSRTWMPPSARSGNKQACRWHHPVGRADECLRVTVTQPHHPPRALFRFPRRPLQNNDGKTGWSFTASRVQMLGKGPKRIGPSFSPAEKVAAAPVSEANMTFRLVARAGWASSHPAHKVPPFRRALSRGGTKYESRPRRRMQCNLTGRLLGRWRLDDRPRDSGTLGPFPRTAPSISALPRTASRRWLSSRRMISVQRQDTWGVVGLDPRGQYEYTGTRSDPARKTPGRAQTAMPSGQGEQMASVAASHHGVVAAARLPALRTVMAPKSEEECFELLVKELSSIPDREPPVAQNGETSPDGGQLTPVASESRMRQQDGSGVPAHTRDAVTSTSSAPGVGTATNVMIARTIRAAMSDIRPSS
ncbi:hypothetical protein Purlil1_10704 [Purpureocillium lilacinum]|uniref:Uncharacterized protein n=1 Tax=Purpureocillium lilacinum TaxID=33203 RepID=A0ABR0BLP7_PURLI|nr:hypothetical protein Purlil1_10704 [Purpureocillium lilacinum]